MAPGDVAHVPRTPSPVAGAGPVARHFRSRARLRRLLVRLRRPTPSTPALRATPGGASLTTFGFVTTVPRYLPEASKSLTFVRGACRACCAPRRRLRRATDACMDQSPRTWPPQSGAGRSAFADLALDLFDPLAFRTALVELVKRIAARNHAAARRINKAAMALTRRTNIRSQWHLRGAQI